LKGGSKIYIKCKPLFKCAEISDEMFANESSAYIDYQVKTPMEKEGRGGMEYYFPLGFMGFGLNVRKIYDKGND